MWRRWSQATPPAWGLRLAGETTGATGGAAGREATTEPDGSPKPRSLWITLGWFAGAGAGPGTGCATRRSARRRFAPARRIPRARRPQRRGVVDQRDVAHRRQRNDVRQQFAVAGGAAGGTGAESRGRRNRARRSRVGLGRGGLATTSGALGRRSRLSAPLGLDDHRAEKSGRVFVSRQRQGGRQAQARGWARLASDDASATVGAAPKWTCTT